DRQDPGRAAEPPLARRARAAHAPRAARRVVSGGARTRRALARASAPHREAAVTLPDDASLVDVAFAACTALARAGETAVLCGGSAASYYVPEVYRSLDIDFVPRVPPAARTCTRTCRTRSSCRWGRSRSGASTSPLGAPTIAASCCCTSTRRPTSCATASCTIGPGAIRWGSTWRSP